jgi:hypothetical protein
VMDDIDNINYNLNIIHVGGKSGNQRFARIASDSRE